MSLYKSFVKPIFFSYQPEKAHHLAMNSLTTLTKIPGMKGILKGLFKVSDPSLEREVFGIKFPSPVGIAAGFDKDAKYIDQLDCLGFGFVEIGTLTPKGQDGNPQPRLFRLPQDEALINRMGFNNGGVEGAIPRLKNRKSKIIVGGNIGKNKVTPNAEATEDYVKCYKALVPYVDYFVVNVSSPNTPNLRELQEKEPLKKLLSTLIDLDKKLNGNKPILLKIAPDLTDEQLDDIVEIVLETGMAGIVATNTTIAREPLSTQKSVVDEIGAGGLSGKPVKERSTDVIRYIHQKSEGKFPIIGVGGIQTAKDAQEKLDAGASLVQVYSGFIYEGPAMAKNINKGLING